MKKYPVVNLGQTQAPAEELRRTGAIVDVTIGVPASYAAKGGAGSPQTVKGMVDTGASISTVSERVAQAAGLQKIGSVPIGGVGGTSERPIYAAAVGLPKYGVSVDPVEIGGVDIALTGVDVLVGRDILKALKLDYEGPQGVFQLVQEAGAPAATPASAKSNAGGLPTAVWITIAGGVGAAVVGTLFALDVF